MPRDALIVIPFLVVVLVGGAGLLTAGRGGECRGYAFEPGEWRRAGTAGEGRERIAQRLDDCRGLEGERRPQVRRLLGPPDAEEPDAWIYVLGTAPEGPRVLRVVFRGPRVSDLRTPD